jgi:hypothetical protein
MLKCIISILMLAGMPNHVAQAAETIGFREITLPDAGRHPAAERQHMVPQRRRRAEDGYRRNPASVGLPFVKDAQPSSLSD